VAAAPHSPSAEAYRQLARTLRDKLAATPGRKPPVIRYM
jgi:hypothetical protein